MVAEVKPTKVARWNDDLTNQTEPIEGKKDEGWAIDEAPDSSFFNFLMHFTGRWHKWINQRFFDGAAARDLVVKGVDADAGVDQDGGDVTVSGGDTTGDQGSEVLFKTAQPSGSGSGDNVAALVAKFGEDGVLQILEGLVAQVSTGVALKGIGGVGGATGVEGESLGGGPAVSSTVAGGASGYGVEAMGHASGGGTKKASLLIGEQAADPGSLDDGAIWVLTNGDMKARLNGVTKILSSVPSPAYTRDAVIVVDRTLLASASATTTNNNNVLAALIVDLQARGFLG